MTKREIHFELTRDDHGYVEPNFNSIESILGNKSLIGKPVVLYGKQIHEEKLAYFGRGYDYNTPSFGKIGVSPARLASNKFKGNFSVLRKIDQFLSNWNEFTYKFLSQLQESDYERGISDINSISDAEMFESMSFDYVDTRKKKEGAYDEIEKFWEGFIDKSAEGPVFLSDNSSYENLLCAWMWARHLSHRYPLIILSHRETYDDFDAGRKFERQYFSLSDIIHYAGYNMGINESTVKAVLPFWSASRYDNSSVLQGKFTANSAASVLVAIGKIRMSEGDLLRLPEQKLAPMRFEISEDQIGLLRESVNDISPTQRLGAARALRGLADDVLSIGGLDNAVPNWDAKVRRIKSIIDRMTLAGASDSSDVIELGVEVSGFESRVHQARDRIGDLTIGEVLSFLIEARSFLEKFEDWREYEVSVSTNRDNYNSDNADAALDILRNFASADGVLTDDARDRINQFTSESIVDPESPIKGKGYTSVAENLATVSARKVIDVTRNEIKSGFSDAAGEIRKKLSKKIADLLIQNSGAIFKIAASRGDRWFELVVEFIKSHS